MSAFCTKCGNGFSESNQFCGKCGAARTAAPATPAMVKKRLPRWLRLSIVWGAVGMVGLAIIGALTPGDYQQKKSAPAAPAIAAAKTEFPEEIADQQYEKVIGGLCAPLAQSMFDWADLMKDPRLQDDGWKLQVATILAIWKSSCQTAQKIMPPQRWAAVNQDFLAALSNLNGAADDFAHGLDAGDVDEIKQATAEMQESSSIIKQMSKKIGAMKSDQ